MANVLQNNTECDSESLEAIRLHGTGFVTIKA